MWVCTFTPLVRVGPLFWRLRVVTPGDYCFVIFPFIVLMMTV